MAKIVILFLVLVLNLATTSIAGRKIRPTMPDDFPYTTRNYTKVCDRFRFRDLGLDIKNFPYCDSSLPIEIRIKDLIDRMTLEEKAGQLGNHAQGVERIGFPTYEWWSEALHGVSNVGPGTHFDARVPGATSFPTPILTTASFNETLWKVIGQAVSTEARAMHNLDLSGMTFWSPNINVVRDPRWGRTLETSGEDALVVGRYATNYVRGLQDIVGEEHSEEPSTRPLKVAACCKHYVAYDVDNWKNVVRETFNARVHQRDMIETFQKPFEMCVLDGDVASVMCSYNQVDGIPTCANAALLKETIRGKWGLNGYIVSDCDSVEVMHDRQHFLGLTPEEDVALVLESGLDLDCGRYYTDHLPSAALQGKVRVSDMDNALSNLYLVLMRLGFFDGRPEFEELGAADVCTKENIDLASQAAREGMVLLKNDHQTLPLFEEDIKTLAVIGPHSKATSVMIGNYAGIPCRYTTPLDALNDRVQTIHEMGCNDVFCTSDAGIPAAVEAAKKADATVLIVGISLGIEAESRDRVDLLLPGHQTHLINQVALAAKGPVVLVVMSAGGLDISFAKSNPNVKAIIWAGYPGQEGGRGIADVIFGKYNPSGRLPITWYENNYVNMVPMTYMSMRPFGPYPGRTYKFFNGSVVYPFGYGLSYTTFSYKIINPKTVLNVQLEEYTQCRDLNYIKDSDKPACPAVLVEDISSKEDEEDIEDNFSVDFSVEVKNTGNVDGSEVVMVYWIPPKGIADQTPIKQLVAFEKIFIEAGKSERIKFKLNAVKDLGLVDYQAYTLLAAGRHTIAIGENIVSFPLSINLFESKN